MSKKRKKIHKNSKKLEKFRIISKIQKNWKNSK
jgi:hypothetical protein